MTTLKRLLWAFSSFEFEDLLKITELLYEFHINHTFMSYFLSLNSLTLASPTVFISGSILKKILKPAICTKGGQTQSITSG